MELFLYVAAAIAALAAGGFGFMLWQDGDPLARLLAVEIWASGLIGAILMIGIARAVTLLGSINRGIATLVGERPHDGLPRPAPAGKPERPTLALGRKSDPAFTPANADIPEIAAAGTAAIAAAIVVDEIEPAADEAKAGVEAEADAEAGAGAGVEPELEPALEVKAPVLSATVPEPVVPPMLELPEIPAAPVEPATPDFADDEDESGTSEVDEALHDALAAAIARDRVAAPEEPDIGPEDSAEPSADETDEAGAAAAAPEPAATGEDGRDRLAELIAQLAGERESDRIGELHIPDEAARATPAATPESALKSGPEAEPAAAPEAPPEPASMAKATTPPPVPPILSPVATETAPPVVPPQPEKAGEEARPAKEKSGFRMPDWLTVGRRDDPAKAAASEPAADKSGTGKSPPEAPADPAEQPSDTAPPPETDTKTGTKAKTDAGVDRSPKDADAGQDETDEPIAETPAESAAPLAEPVSPDRKLVKRGLWRGRDIRVYDDGTVALMTEDGWRTFSSIRAMHHEIGR
ncbi:MAG: hypothetical protein R3D02_06645 [Hyphomicrobiales bacterium]